MAYYIATINIEETFHDLIGAEEYTQFEGIVLTDTFAMTEKQKIKETEGDGQFIEMFAENSERANKQLKSPITVIIGNPPYSVGQRSANDNNQNTSYPFLDTAIAKTYVYRSNAALSASVYDTYIKAFRWATDRLGDNGVIGFVSNGAWLDGVALDGFRECLIEEFNHIYVFNLRGNQRTSGELSRKEGGKIFGSGSRTPVAITKISWSAGLDRLWLNNVELKHNTETRIVMYRPFCKKCVSFHTDVIERLSKWLSVYPESITENLAICTSGIGGNKGFSAIEWIMESYRVKTDKDSGITDDPNTYGDEKYIFNLLISVISVSLKTLDLIESMPEYKEI